MIRADSKFLLILVKHTDLEAALGQHSPGGVAIEKHEGLKYCQQHRKEFGGLGTASAAIPAEVDAVLCTNQGEYKHRALLWMIKEMIDANSPCILILRFMGRKTRAKSKVPAMPNPPWGLPSRAASWGRPHAWKEPDGSEFILILFTFPEESIGGVQHHG